MAVGPAVQVVPPGQNLKTPWSVLCVSRSSWIPQSTRAKTFTVFATGIQVHPLEFKFYAVFLLILFSNDKIRVFLTQLTLDTTVRASDVELS